MSRKANPTLIGTFVLGGVLLAVVAVVVFGSGRLFRDTRTYISFFDGSVAGLQVGAPVKFRGVDVGQVTEVLLDLPGVERVTGDARIAVVYELDRESLESRGAAVRLSDPLDIEVLLGIGVRAHLATESLVTGRKYVALDLDPEAAVEREPVEGAPYPEIPTVDTGLDRIQEELYGIIADLGAVPLDSLVSVATLALSEVRALAGSPELALAVQRLPTAIDDLTSTAAELRTLMASVDASLTPMRDGFLATTDRAAAAMQQFETTLQAVSGTMEAESPAMIRFEQAMVELGAASRALRDLASYLERNPSALVRGRPGGER
jgi:paraquat-inducible protein B